MKQSLRTLVALAVTLVGTTFVPGLKADEWNKKTTITIDQSIDVQGTVLPAGSYVIKLLGEASARSTVQIFNPDDNHLIATIIAAQPGS